jgi:hypothetical protein
MAAPPPPDPDQPPYYPVEPRPRRNWRHLRAAITLLVLIALVIGAAAYAWSQLAQMTDGDDDVADTTIPDPTCAVIAPTDAPDPADIGLNVYNATDRSGLAQSVAGEMRERGFAILDVANDPTSRTVVHVAEIRATDEDQPGVELLMSHFPGAVFYADERTDPSIDLVLGGAFEGVAPEPAAGEPAEPEGTATPLPPC